MSLHSLKAMAVAIIREAWAAYAESGDPRDLEIAEEVTKTARQPDEPKRPKKPNPWARARMHRTFKQGARIDSNAPILPQVRNIVR